MSFDVDSPEHGRSLEVQNEEIIKLLKAILLGIQTIANQDDLLEQVED